MNGKLSERELEVLAGMAKGLSNREIADELFLSEKTVKAHARGLFWKLDARNRTHAVVIAIQEGLVRI